MTQNRSLRLFIKSQISIHRVQNSVIMKCTAAQQPSTPYTDTHTHTKPYRKSPGKQSASSPTHISKLCGRGDVGIFRSKPAVRNSWLTLHLCGGCGKPSSLKRAERPRGPGVSGSVALPGAAECALWAGTVPGLFTHVPSAPRPQFRLSTAPEPNQ